MVLDGCSQAVLDVDGLAVFVHIGDITEEPGGVAALLFGREHGAVGLGEQAVYRVGIIGVHGHAHAEGGVEHIAFNHDGLVAGGHQLGNGLAGAVGTGQLGEEHHELVAAPTGQRVARAQGVAQRVGQEQQQLVACLVAELVVHMLEVVQVHKAQRHLVPTALGRAQGNLATVFEQHAVGQAGQRIVQGHMGDMALHQVALGNVPQHAAHTAYRARTQLTHHKAVFHPHIFGIGAAQTDAALEAGFLAGKKLGKVLLEVGHVVRVETLKQHAAVAALGAGQARPARAGAQVAPVLPDLHHAFFKNVQRLQVGKVLLVVHAHAVHQVAAGLGHLTDFVRVALRGVERLAHGIHHGVLTRKNRRGSRQLAHTKGEAARPAANDQPQQARQGP